jgi:threonine dehydrogenase-like Zn-dependent dehydrogenase
MCPAWDVMNAISDIAKKGINSLVSDVFELDNAAGGFESLKNMNESKMKVLVKFE